jgi:hypothetical protein
VDTSKFQLIREADTILSACGRPVPPSGSVVYIYKGFLVQAVQDVTSDATYYKEVTGDTTWCWRSITGALSATPPAISAMVTTPDGKTLFNSLLDLTVIAGYGSYRYLLSDEIDCPPGSKIQMTLDSNILGASAVQPVSLLMGGAYAYFLKDGQLSMCPEKVASNMPRIQAGGNQNLMVPCWFMGFGPRVRAGYDEEEFVYGNGATNKATVTLGGQLSAKASIQIDNTNDFKVRRFLFDVVYGASVTAGSFLVRIRAGSGYVFTDDYILASKYIGSAMLPKGWDIKRGDQIQFDLALVDGAGTGNVTIECFAEGVKQKQRAA